VMMARMTSRIACASIPDVCVAPRRRRAPTCTREEGAMMPVELSLAWLRFFTCLVICVFALIPYGMVAGEFLIATPHRCRVRPQAVLFRPPSPPCFVHRVTSQAVPSCPPSPPRFVSSFLPDLPLPYWSLADEPPSYRWLAANHKFVCLEPRGRDKKISVDGELCLPPEYAEQIS